MKVKRIVANIETADPAAVARFYKDVLELDLLMDHGWIATYGGDGTMPLQVSFASEGGSGTGPRPSVEVDDVEAAPCGRREGRLSRRIRAGGRALGRASLLRARSGRHARQYRHAHALIQVIAPTCARARIRCRRSRRLRSPSCGRKRSR